MARIKVTRGRAEAAIDDPTADAIIKTIEEQYKEIADRLEGEAKAIYDYAQSKWPVKTGRSKAAMRYGLEFRPPSTLRARVYVDPASEAAEYVWYIGTAHGQRGTWMVLVRDPAAKRAKELTADLGAKFRRSLFKNWKRGRR